MKNILLFIISLLSLSSYSQNLSFNQINSLREKSLAEAEEFLTSKDWNFIGSEGGVAYFSYNQETYGSKAESFINLYIEETTSKVRWVSIQIHKKEKYNEIMNVIKTNGYNLLDSKFSNDGSIVKFYKSKSSIFKLELLSNPKENSVKTNYFLTIVPLEDYEFIQ